MSSSAPSILPLPAEVTAQIGSSSQITSLSDVALELLKNSIDAGARRVNVSLDLGRACCTVEDDGEGIEPNEFCEEGGLAKLHYTSKWHASNSYHGRHGIFLFSLASQSMLTITSHHHLHPSHHSLTIHYGRIIARQTSAAAHQRLSFFDRGTRVVIRDLFGHLPVRVKQRAHLADGGTESERRWEQLRRGVTGLLLASGHALDVVVRDVEGRVKINIRGIHSPLAIDSDHTSISSFRRILSQVGYLSMSSWVSWIPVSNSAWNISITGVISLEPAPSKQIQFLCLGIRPLSFEGHNLLYEEINRIFAESHFGDLDDGHEPISDTERERRTKDRRFKRDGYTSKQLRRTRKGLDRWPMFVLRIDLARGREMVKVAEDVLESGNASDSILELLTAMLTRFLFQHQHRPQPLRTPFRVESNVNENEPPNDRGTSNHRCTPSNRPGGFAMTVKRIPRHLGIAKATRLPGLYRSDTGQVMASNPLNACVSLPCFARRVSPSSGASFADWSRMKSARPSALGQIYGFEGDVRKPMTAPSAGTCRKRAAIAATRPETAPAATINVDTVSCPLKGVPFIQDADEVMEWFDPTKRVVIRINARTGFIAPRESSRWARISTTSTEDMPQPTNRQSLTLKSGTTSSAAREPGPWLGDVLKDWQNPIYKPTESAIHRLPVDEIRLDSATPRFGNIKSRTALLSSKLSKDALRRARVISQVDRKFILVKMRISTESGIERSDCAGREGLVLIDQHAADERCRIEALFSELCSPPEISIPVMSSLGLRSRILTHAIVPPLVYDLLKPDLDLFRRHAAHFAEWGIIYDLLTSTVKGGERSKVSEETSLQVTSLPPTIAERCRATPRILIELLRAEVWKIQDGLVPAIATGSSCCRHDPEGSCGEVSHPEAHRIESTVIASGEPRLPSEETSDWPTRIHSCPAGVIDVLNSRACRGTCFNTLDRAEFR